MRHLDWNDAWESIETPQTAADASVTDHIAVCEQCSAKVELVRRTQSALVILLRSTPPGNEARTEQLLAKLRGENIPVAATSATRPSKRGRLVKLSVSVGSIAAALLFGTLLSYQALHRGSAGSASSAGASGLATSAQATHSLPVQSHTQQSTVKTAMDATSTTDQSTNSYATLAQQQNLRGTAQVTVRDGNGQLLAGAHVAFVASGRILTLTTTDATGHTVVAPLTVPRDPLLNGSFNPQWPPQGVVVVVAWKPGYQPVVNYEVGVFQGATSFQETVTLTPGTAAGVPNVGGSQQRVGYHILRIDQFVSWVEKTAAGLYAAPVQGTSAGFLIKVVDETGKSVQGAHVALVANGVINAVGITSGTGQTGKMVTQGIPDWRLPAGLGPRVTAMVVWKDGYASAVGFNLPVPVSGTRTVTVRLESNAWRTAQHDNNADAASGIAGEFQPSAADAEALVKQVQQVVGPN